MFLPYYLPESTLLRSRAVGISALILWVLGQVCVRILMIDRSADQPKVFWLQQGFQLEFNGHSTFVPGLWASGIFFFIVNVGILSVIIRDVKFKESDTRSQSAKQILSRKRSR